MFKVFYEGVPFARVPSIEEAVSLSLAVHRTANEPHKITVVDIEKDNEVISFSLTEK